MASNTPTYGISPQTGGSIQLQPSGVQNIVAVANPNSNIGDVWLSGTQQAVFDNIQGLVVSEPVVIATLKSVVTLGNSTVETNLIPVASMTSPLIIPTNFMATGKVFRARLSGIIANAGGTPTFRMRSAFTPQSSGSLVAPADTTAVATTAITGTTRFEAEFSTTILSVATRSAVTCVGTGYFRYHTTNVLQTTWQALDQAVTIDDTQVLGNLFSILATWGTAAAGDTLTVQSAIIDMLN